MSTENAEHDQIVQRARLLWEQAGQPEGRDLEFWFKAEAEIKAAAQAAPAAPAAAPEAARSAAVRKPQPAPLKQARKSAPSPAGAKKTSPRSR
jgi:hypothetical protein